MAGRATTEMEVLAAASRVFEQVGFHGARIEAEELEQAARLVGTELPIRDFARGVWLITGSRAPNSWNVKAAFRLGQPLG